MTVEHESPGDAAYAFGLELGGLLTATFKHAGGLESALDTSDMGSEPMQVRADPTPQRIEPVTITLHRGLGNGTEIASWYQQVEVFRHREAHRDGSIILLGPTGTETARWNFTGGWPSSYTASARSSTGAEVVIEELVIRFTTLMRVT